MVKLHSELVAIAQYSLLPVLDFGIQSINKFKNEDDVTQYYILTNNDLNIKMVYRLSDTYCIFPMYMDGMNYF